MQHLGVSTAKCLHKQLNIDIQKRLNMKSTYNTFGLLFVVILLLSITKQQERTSARVARQFKNKGYPNVYAIKGGWIAWRKADYPVEKK